MPTERKHEINIWYIIGAFWLLMLFQSWWNVWSQVETVPYSEFETQLAAGNIAEAIVTETRIEGSFKTAEADGHDRFVTTRVDPDIADRLAAQGVTFSGATESTFFATLLSWIVPVAALLRRLDVRVPRIAERQGLGGLMTIGKRRAKVYVETDTKVTFADVAGVDEAKAELQEIVDFLKDPKGYGRLGARMPKGVLLVGPPGTGKTLLAARWPARPACRSSRSPARSSSRCSSASAPRACATCSSRRARRRPASSSSTSSTRSAAPRGGGDRVGGHDEKEQTLNQLLVELDGFDPRAGIVLLAATNRPEILDPALLRAGRFDRQVLVDRPDARGRVEILKVHVRKVTLAPRRRRSSRSRR